MSEHLSCDGCERIASLLQRGSVKDELVTGSLGALRVETGAKLEQKIFMRFYLFDYGITSEISLFLLL